MIRELRQRCYHKSKRNEFKATYKSLGKALGVSEKTIKRALARDESGQFKNTYLDCFIKSADVVRIRREDGTVRNEGTKFVIYLDEPLIPEDEAKITEGTK